MRVGSGKLAPLILSIMALAVAACSPKPSESEAHQVLESRLKESYTRTSMGSGEVDVRVVKFSKTDGLAKVKDGAKYYTMEYQAEIVFPKGYKSGFSTSDYKAGEGYTTNGRLEFVRTENGWRLVGITSPPQL